MLAGCAEPSAQERADAAQAALNGGKFAAARADAEAGLARDGTTADKALTWRLEKLRLDAMAGSGDGEEVLASLTRLAATHPDKVDASLYVALTDKLAQEGKFVGAIDVAHAGQQKFPDRAEYFDEEMTRLMDAAKRAAEGGDNTALDHLAGLGYLSKPK